MPGPESEIKALLAINRVASSFPAIGASIYAEFESALHFLEEFSSNQANFPPALSGRILDLLARPDEALKNNLARDSEWCLAEGHAIVSIFDAEYPALLKHIQDPPLCLFASGNLALLKRDQLAIVGSRKPTQTGLKIARSFADSLAELGIVITSGLAIGIDAAAHIGALQNDAETIAVLGTGCDYIYPRRHERLAMRIMERGLIISEFPLGTKAFPGNFPQRNRIVTGLSLGTLVVEAAEKSGSLISARMAMEQAREVFAVPGSIYSNQSTGCHQLIKVGAKLTQSVRDIVEELPGYAVDAQLPHANMSHEEMLILKYLDGEARSADSLIELTGIPVSEILALLVNLEIGGHIVSDSLGFVLARKQD